MKRWIVPSLVLTDTLSSVAATGVYIGSRAYAGQGTSLEVSGLILATLALVWVAIYGAAGLYRKEHHELRLKGAKQLGLATAVGVLLLFFFIAQDNSSVPTRVHFLTYFTAQLSLAILARAAHTVGINALYRNGIGLDNMLIVGRADTAERARNAVLGQPERGFHPVAVVALEDHDGSAVRAQLKVYKRGQLEERIDLPDLNSEHLDQVLPKLKNMYGLETVLVVLDRGDIRHYLEVVRACNKHLMQIKFLPEVRPIVGNLPAEAIMEGLFLSESNA